MLNCPAVTDHPQLVFAHSQPVSHPSSPQQTRKAKNKPGRME